MSLEFETGYLESSLPELESYLLSEELFWPVHGNPPGRDQAYPRLTIGSVLLSLERAKAFAETAFMGAQVIQISTRVNVIRTKWRTRWEDKAHREILSRLNQWRNYLMEYRQNPERQADFYPQEVRWRVMAELLEKEVDQLSEAEEEMLNGLDNIVRGVLEPGEFVWSAEVQSSFPPSPFWYLYGLPRADD